MGVAHSIETAGDHCIISAIAGYLGKNNTLNDDRPVDESVSYHKVQTAALMMMHLKIACTVRKMSILHR